MARPLKEIDWKEFDKLCEMHCTIEEVAGWFDCHPDTIQNAVQREKEVSFSVYFEQKAGNGKTSLRRIMWQMALQGDKTMCIWLSKQYLGFAEKNEITLGKIPDSELAKEIQSRLEATGEVLTIEGDKK